MDQTPVFFDIGMTQTTLILIQVVHWTQNRLLMHFFLVRRLLIHYIFVVLHYYIYSSSVSSSSTAVLNSCCSKTERAIASLQHWRSPFVVPLSFTACASCSGVMMLSMIVAWHAPRLKRENCLCRRFSELASIAISHLHQPPIIWFCLSNIVSGRKSDTATIHTICDPISGNGRFFNARIWREKMAR